MNAKIHYSIIDNEAGNIIEHAETIEQARQIIAECESADKKYGTYTPNFYSIREERDSGHTDAWVKNDNIEHPKHYTSHPSGIECIQITRHMGFNLGNAIKYIWRADLKNDAIEDLKKAVWYLQDEIKKRENQSKGDIKLIQGIDRIKVDWGIMYNVIKTHNRRI